MRINNYILYFCGSKGTVAPHIWEGTSGQGTKLWSPGLGSPDMRSVVGPYFLYQLQNKYTPDVHC